MINRRSPKGPPSANVLILRAIFVRHVHDLLYRGYQQLTVTDYKESEEEDITGDLKDAIDRVLDERPERWMIHYFASEETPITSGKKKGKRRKKIDIHVVSSRYTPRAKFAFEAKRLGRRNTISIYLGAKGLGRFLSGAYGRDCDEGGMLGYVQDKSVEEWSTKLTTDFAAKSRALAADPAGIARHQLFAGLTESFRSMHNRMSVGRPIQIFHTLLQFH